MKLEIDNIHCEKIAEKLKSLGLKNISSPTLKFELPSQNYERNLEYCFFLSALLFDFRGLDGVINGEALHGSDYFFTCTLKKFQEDPLFFTPERMSKVTVNQLKAIFSPDGKPANTVIRRAKERVEVLQDCARKLLEKYDGSVSKLLRRSEGYLVRKDRSGLIDLLREFKGYEDPHFKKGYVLLMTYEKHGLFKIKDRENLFVPVDYHLMRVALRSGIVEVIGKSLKKRLQTKSPITAGEESEIRDYVKKAYKIIEQSSEIETFDLNQIFWNLGRSCCHYSYEPRCHQCPRTHCSFQQSLNYKCIGLCPIVDACIAGYDFEHRNMFEPMIQTTYY